MCNVHRLKERVIHTRVCMTTVDVNYMCLCNYVHSSFSYLYDCTCICVCTAHVQLMRPRIGRNEGHLHPRELHAS